MQSTFSRSNLPELSSLNLFPSNVCCMDEELPLVVSFYVEGCKFDANVTREARTEDG